MKRLISVLLTLTLLWSLALPASAASSAKAAAMRLDTVEGTVTVKNASGKKLSAKDGMRLYSGYTLETSLASYCYISLDDSKVIKLDAQTKVELQKSGKKLEVELCFGKLLFDVSEKLAGDESLNIRTATMLTGVRGTTGLLSYDCRLLVWNNPAKTVPQTTISLLSGQVDVNLAQTGQIFTVQPGTTLTLGDNPDDGSTQPATLAPMTDSGLPGFVLDALARTKSIMMRILPAVQGRIQLVEQVEKAPEILLAEQRLAEEWQAQKVVPETLESLLSGIAAKVERVPGLVSVSGSDSDSGGSTVRYPLSFELPKGVGIKNATKELQYYYQDGMPYLTLARGEAFSFELDIKEGYCAVEELLKVTSDGIAISSDEAGRYSIQGSGTNMTVSVTGVYGEEEVIFLPSVTEVLQGDYGAYSALRYVEGALSTEVADDQLAKVVVISAKTEAPGVDPIPEPEGGTVTASIGAGQILVIERGAALQYTTSGDCLSVLSGGTLLNNGTLDTTGASGTTRLTVGGTLNNYGTLQMSSGDWRITSSGTLYSEGTISTDFAGSCDGNIYNCGTLTCNVGSTFTNGANLYTYRDPGAQTGGTMNVYGTLTQTHQTLYIGRTIPDEAAYAGTLTTSSVGTLNNRSAVEINSLSTLTNGGTFACGTADTTGDLRNAGVFRNNGAFTCVNGSSIYNSGSFLNNGSLTNTNAHFVNRANGGDGTPYGTFDTTNGRVTTTAEGFDQQYGTWTGIRTQAEYPTTYNWTVVEGIVTD